MVGVKGDRICLEKHVTGERFSCVVEGVEVLLNIPVSTYSPF
jgi:hypothetical protein